MTKVLNLSDLSDGEITMLRQRADAKFSEDGKTVEMPPELATESELSVEEQVAASIEAVRKNAPPVPEDVAKKLQAGFEPPKSSMHVEEDGKVITESGGPQPPKAKEADAADIAAYVRCILSGKPFTKSYQFMGGMVEATFQERTGAEEEDVLRRAAKTVAQNDSNLMLAMLVSRYRLAYSLMSLRVGKDTKTYTKPACGAMIKDTHLFEVDQRVADISAMPSSMTAILSVAASEFSDVVFDIARKANDPKCWQTASAV